MSSFHFSLENDFSSSQPYIEMGLGAQEANLYRLLQNVYPEETLHWTVVPYLQDIDIYVIIELCAYGAQESSYLHQAIQRALKVLTSKQLKPEALILIILYRDLKVNFPERKLQREKVMSEMFIDEILHQEAPDCKEQISISHEFGLQGLKNTLQQLEGKHLYFEIMPHKDLQS
jgi:hypothetical protein